MSSSAWPLVKPLPSQKVRRSFGINAHPNNLQSGYGATNAWMTALDSVGASYFRGLYAPGLPATLQVLDNCRNMGLKWGMLVAQDINTDPAYVVSTIRHIADHGADRCLFIEGVNEPNNVRGPNSIPQNWQAKATNLQRVIYQTVRSDRRLDDVVVVGPSLRDVAVTPTDNSVLEGLGLANYMDTVGLHRYPNANYPDFLMDDRVSTLNAAWPGKPLWITELGYTNALAATSGQLSAPEDVAAAYGPAALLEAADRGMKMCWYELLDDSDGGPKDDVESNFGLFGTISSAGPPWRPKPIVGALRAFLDLLNDPGPGFNTTKIPLKVTSSIPDVKSTVTAKRDGSVMVHLRRATNEWDPRAQQRIAVAPATVTVATPSSSVTVQVTNNVLSVPL